MIDYDHAINSHGREGPCAALPIILRDATPSSLLDVGCGTGDWLVAARQIGVKDLFGIDGINALEQDIGADPTRFKVIDLESDWSLGRRFDVILCLEVAEHISEQGSKNLIRSLVRHSDHIVFSAASPGQFGQHHVNCQWPLCWQERFNREGYACDDRVRWRIWNISEIEPWYRQNMFSAYRAPEQAGIEPRIPAVVHPDMLSGDFFHAPGVREAELKARIESGSEQLTWYMSAPIRACLAKIRRRLNN